MILKNNILRMKGFRISYFILRILALEENVDSMLILSWRNNKFTTPFSSVGLQNLSAFTWDLRSPLNQQKYFIIKLYWNFIFSNALANKTNGSPTSEKVLFASFNLKRTVSSNCWGFISIDSENSKILLSQETDLMPLAIIQPRTC